MYKVIGFNGYKRSGKNAAADAVIERWPGGFVKHVGFADKVKIATMKVLGFDRPDEELIALANEAKEQWIIDITDQDTPDNVNAKRPQAPFHDLSGREALQYMGTEVGRDMFGESFWVDQVLPNPHVIVSRDSMSASDLPRVAAASLRNRYPGVSILCITDIRFENEAQRVLDCGGEVWRITRPGVGGTDGHSSEQPLPDHVVTREIANDGTLEDLSNKVAVELANVAANYERKVAA